jgi:DNA mismatch repair protein MutS
MKMYQEYIELYQTYTKKYGPNTAIFLMVGSFYELYDIQDQETGQTQANVREIVDYLGIQLSTKKGEQGKDCLFAGFPDYVMHKWAGRLTSTGWTVVIVDQIKDIRGKVKERKVSRILSPSMHVEHTSSIDTPYSATLYFQSYAEHPPLLGAAILDSTTGTTRTFSGSARGRPDIWTADELVQLLTVYPPKEIMVYWNGILPEESLFRRMLGLSSIPLYLRPVNTHGSFVHELVRTEYLQKIYSMSSILPIRTYLGLRSEHEEYALLYLLQFVEEHDSRLLQSFSRNESWNPNTTLICGNHALTQLQMTSANPSESVLGLFNKCITVMGKRAIKERILRPYSNASEIRSRLKEIQEYVQWPEEKTKALHQQLRFMFDLPRLHRKLRCGLIDSSEIAGLFQTYSAMHVIMTQVTPQTALQEPFTQREWSDYLFTYHAHFTEEKAKTACADHTAFCIETYPEIGKKEEDIRAILEQFQQLRRSVARQGGLQEDAIRLEEREKEPYGLKVSTITLQQLKRNVSHLPEGTHWTELKSGGWVDCTALQQLNATLLKHRDALQHLTRIHMAEACSAVSDAGQLWPLMEQWISHLDGTQCIATVSHERGFCCPIIEDAEEGSFLEIKQMRHPLVEATSSRISYVTHDVTLGHGKKGWLLYGVNSSGKSTVMKATGVCVLLAQAGCFVPAQSMRLHPFRAVYTRILHQDNLFAGLSSFAVEMSELRDILRHANAHTLVLGDELCAGTESVSAQALVASGIQWLYARKAAFMFATHLHDIPRLVEQEADTWHLHVDYHPVTKKLIYDRSLRPGSGSTLYGLEVAQAMDLPAEFMEHALANRHRIMGSIPQEKATSSSWNREIVRKECEICKNPMGLEVHHLHARATATHQILENGTHMNDKRNLIVICQICHDNVHAGKITIGPLQQTSTGPERMITQTTMGEPAAKKGKWSEEELEIVKNTLQKYSSLSLKAIRAHLSSKHSIEMSESILGRIRKEKDVSCF